MEGYAVLMLIFAGCLFLYAGILAKTKDIKLIPRSYAAETKNKEQHAENVAKATGLAALAPLASALVACRPWAYCSWAWYACCGWVRDWQSKGVEMIHACSQAWCFCLLKLYA